MASDTFRSPHGPCPPSNTQLKRPLRDLASALVDPQVTSDLGDRLPGLEHHLDGFGLELRAEPAPLLWHGQIHSAASHCPRSLVHPSVTPEEASRRSRGDAPRETIRGLVRGELPAGTSDRLARAL